MSFDPHDGSISNLTVSYFNPIPAAIQLGLSRRGTSSARPSLETRLFRAVSFGTCQPVSLEDLSQTTQQCRHLYVLKSVDIVDTPTRTVEGRLVYSKVPTDNIDEIHCFHSLSPLLDMKIAPSTDILNPTKLFAFVGRFKEITPHPEEPAGDDTDHRGSAACDSAEHADLEEEGESVPAALATHAISTLLTSPDDAEAQAVLTEDLVSMLSRGEPQVRAITTLVRMHLALHIGEAIEIITTAMVSGGEPRLHLG